MSDEDALDFFKLAAQALKPGGWIATYDPCFTPDQSAFSRYLMSKDRGRFIRTKDQYELIASTHCARIKTSVQPDLVRLPLPTIMMKCRP
jgi:hypothetical protein